MGRWLTADPIGFQGGKNLYRYAGNSPEGFRDPFGLKRETVSFSYNYTVEYAQMVPDGAGGSIQYYEQTFTKSRSAYVDYSCSCSNGQQTLTYNGYGWSDGGSTDTGFSFSIWILSVGAGDTLTASPGSATSTGSGVQMTVNLTWTSKADLSVGLGVSDPDVKIDAKLISGDAPLTQTATLSCP